MKEIALLSITHIHSNKHSFVVILVQMRWRCKYLTSQRRNFFLIFGTFSYIYWYDVNSTICTLFIVCVCFVQFMPISSHPETGWIALFYDANERARTFIANNRKTTAVLFLVHWANRKFYWIWLWRRVGVEWVNVWLCSCYYSRYALLSRIHSRVIFGWVSVSV